MPEHPAERLQALGMTEWEARAYLALLRQAPATGYATAKASQVPRSKIYEVLQSLETKGAIRVSRAEPAQYSPLKPDELLDRLRRRHADQLEAAQASLQRYTSAQRDYGEIWDLQGRERIIEQAGVLIASAQRRILMEVWQPDACELAAPIERAIARGVRITAVCYGDVVLPGVEIFSHPSTDDVTAGLGGRWLVLSVDDRDIVAGIVSSGRQSRAASTSHPGLVVPITELVTHDLYKLVVLAAHPELEEEFGAGLAHLRDRFSSLSEIHKTSESLQ